MPSPRRCPVPTPAPASGTVRRPCTSSTSSTVDRVAEELRRAIFDGELESGTPLREVALAESLGVSRPTVREALAVLVAEGLATREPHRGVNVATPERGVGARRAAAARWVLEGAGVRRWARGHRRRSASACAPRCAPTPTPCAADGTYQELNERHLAFHVSLVGLTGSPRLVAHGRGLVVELKLALAQVERIHRNAHDQAETHTALVQLLEDDDVRRRGRLPARAPRRTPRPRSSRRSAWPDRSVGHAPAWDDRARALPDLAPDHRDRPRRRGLDRRRHPLPGPRLRPRRGRGEDRAAAARLARSSAW